MIIIPKLIKADYNPIHFELLLHCNLKLDHAYSLMLKKKLHYDGDGLLQIEA